jgi:hypothetical protein
MLKKENQKKGGATFVFVLDCVGWLRGGLWVGLKAQHDDAPKSQIYKVLFNLCAHSYTNTVYL